MAPSKYLLAALLLSFCVTAPFSRAAEEASAPAAPLPSEAIKLDELFRGEVTKLSQQYTEAIKNLPSLLQEQLAALQKKLQDEGDLDGYLLVKAEIKRLTQALKGESDPFEKIPELPDSALVEKPASLRDLQDKYIKAHKTKSDVRDKKVEDLARNYVQQMECLRTTLTKEGRIPDAIAVNEEIKRIKKGLEDKTFVQQVLTGKTAKPPAAGEDAANTNAPAATPAKAAE